MSATTADVGSTTTRAGAEALAARIEAYWRDQGWKVRAIPTMTEGNGWTVLLPDLDERALPRPGTPRTP